MTERKTLVVSGKSWHGRLYRFWLQHAQFKYQNEEYRENLCHYVRVVLFWTPLTWIMLAQPSNRLKWLRPWMPLSVVGVITLLTVCLMRWPFGTKEMLRDLGIFFLRVGLTMAVTMAVACGIFLLIDWHKSRQPKPQDGDSFVSVAKEFVASKKARICPYIDRKDMQ